jgi:protein ImuB
VVCCALIPRLALVAALGERREMIGRQVALAPEPDGPQVIGEVSGAAEAFGVRAGMRLAEALSRCPALILIPPDPARAEAGWEHTLRRLEAIGAAVEPGRAGEAFFAIEPLIPLYGGTHGVLARVRQAVGPPARFAAGPSRLAAHAAAARARARRPAPVVEERAARRLLRDLPVAALRDALAWPLRPRRENAAWERLNLPETLERLGVRTLGELAELPAAAVADRFGEAGLRALRIARGADEPLRPRRPHEELTERIALPEAVSGPQLERALGLLIDRMLARRSRGGRTIRRLRLEANLAAGGGWRAEVALRSASASAERLRLSLEPRLANLPAPAASLTLRALELGPEASDAQTLARSPAEERRGRLAEAVRQVRTAAGRDAILRVLEVNPDSRVPERRAVLTPWSDGPSGD